MTYAEAIQYLFSLQVFGASFGLERTLHLAQLAGNPQNQLRFIHVAGTNGKGSVCAMLESIYRAGGLRVGLYTSPHLVSFRERIQVNRIRISESDVMRLVAVTKDQLRQFPEDQHPTFFEVVTVMALRYFAEQRCELVIWETGLGGRLDATNIVTPLASVITNVQFDHEKWLGNTLEAIAREKAGIIKPRVPVITAADDVALKVIRETAAHLLAPLTVVSSAEAHLNVVLRGAHQRVNAAVAATTARVLASAIPAGADAIARGLTGVDWPARFQVLQRGHQTIVLDGAHNPAGASALAEALRREFGHEPLSFVVGMLDDKNWADVMATFAERAQEIVCVPVASKRGALPVLLADAARGANPKLVVNAAPSITEAMSLLRHARVVVVTGSLYLVGEAMELFGLSEAADERSLNEWSAPPR